MAKTRLTLSDLGEDALLEKILAGMPAAGLKVGPGDDCAVADPVPPGYLPVLKTDCVVEGRHFLPETPPALVGRKALARAASDFAAMGATPTHALITVLSPKNAPATYWVAAYRGIAKAARGWGISIAGGELSEAPMRAISVSLTGTVKAGKAVLRSGGKPGDFLYVTGHLGGSIRGHHLKFHPRLAEGAFLAQTGFASAMMDLSDGPGSDLPRLALASGCGFRVDRTALPARRGCTADQAWSDGEDYELLFACPPSRSAALEDRWAREFPGLPLTRIGELVKEKNLPREMGGYDHFRVASRPLKRQA